MMSLGKQPAGLKDEECNKSRRIGEAGGNHYAHCTAYGLQLIFIFDD